MLYYIYYDFLMADIFLNIKGIKKKNAFLQILFPYCKLSKIIIMFYFKLKIPFFRRISQFLSIKNFNSKSKSFATQNMVTAIDITTQ